MDTRRYVWLWVLWMCLGAGTASAASFQTVFPLGSIGGRGQIEGGKPTITVTWLYPGGPGERTGLKVGDKIVWALGQDFPPHDTNPNRRLGPLETLGLAIDLAEGRAGKLPLKVLRDGTPQEIDVMLPRRGSFGTDYPFDCAKSQQLYEQICVRMADSFARGQVKGGKVTLALSALTLLGHQTGKYDEIVGDYARKLANEYNNTSDYTGKSVWMCYYDGVVMCEYYLINPDEEIKTAIASLAKGLSDHIPDHGRFGHGLRPLTDRNAVAYSGQGLNATTSGVLWFYASAARCGIEPDIYRSGFDKCLARIRRDTNGNGGVGYAWGGDDQSPLRSGNTGLAMYHLMLTKDLVDPQDAGLIEYSKRVGGWAARFPDRLMEAHAVSSLGVTSGLAGLCAHDPEQFKEVMQQWRWYFALSWEPAGDARAATSGSSDDINPNWWLGYVGGKGNVGGDYYLNGHRSLTDPNLENYIMPATVGFVLAASHQRLSFYGGFPAIPGVNYNLLTSGKLRRGYNLMRYRRYVEAMAIFESMMPSEAEPKPEPQLLDDDLRTRRPDLAISGRSGRDNESISPEEAEIAKLLYDYIDQQFVQPAFAELEAVFTSGDLYLANEQAKAFLRELGKLELYGDRVEALQDQYLSSPEQRRTIQLGRRYYDLEKTALDRPSRHVDHVRRFIEQNDGTFYADKARELLKKVEAMDTPSERNQQELRDALGPTLIR